MEELPEAGSERAKVLSFLLAEPAIESDIHPKSPLFIHLAHGLAYTVGSALGSHPPSIETCLAAFQLPNSAGLSAGARAWSKHAHRTLPVQMERDQVKKTKASAGWWGTPSGPVAVITENALALFWKVVHGATWRNLHWLPHRMLVYEMRVAEGYGMRWYQDQGNHKVGENAEDAPWTFRGFVEPMMENGHEVGWRHPIAIVNEEKLA